MHTCERLITAYSRDIFGRFVLGALNIVFSDILGFLLIFNILFEFRSLADVSLFCLNREWTKPISGIGVMPNGTKIRKHT